MSFPRITSILPEEYKSHCKNCGMTIWLIEGQEFWQTATGRILCCGKANTYHVPKDEDAQDN